MHNTQECQAALGHPDILGKAFAEQKKGLTCSPFFRSIENFTR